MKKTCGYRVLKLYATSLVDPWEAIDLVTAISGDRLSSNHLLISGNPKRAASPKLFNIWGTVCGGMDKKV